MKPAVGAAGSIVARHKEHRRLRTKFLAGALWIAASTGIFFGSALAQTIVDNSTGDRFIASFGKADTTTYGQTFRPPNSTDTRLEKFSFFLQVVYGPAQFKAYVMEWDPTQSQVTGPVLYASNTMELAQNSNMVEVEITTGGTLLDPTKEYVAFFSTAGLHNNTYEASYWRGNSNNPAPLGGKFVYHNSSGSFPGPGTTWECGSECFWDPRNAAFRMTFSSPLFPFAGFFAPVDNLPTVNRVRAGSAVPVSFSLSGDRGLDIFASGFPRTQQVACSSAMASDDVEETVTPGSSTLSYDTATDVYTYVMKTDRAWGSTCRELVVKLKDGSERKVSFSFSR